eukprot:6202347-Pyramimonas_sp.AAC.1
MGGSKMRSTLQQSKKHSEQGAQKVQVFDDKGVDVTPKPLGDNIKPTVLGAKGAPERLPQRVSDP